jgi:hypothetical protein
MSGPPRKLPIALDCLLLALFTAWMILPLFSLRYMNRWISQESTYIGDARFLAEHWPHPRWQPSWYAGTRFDYLFPPLLRYATALPVHARGMHPARAYHLVTAIFYCLGIAAVYLLLRICRGSRAAGWMAALGTLLFSPVLLFLPRIYVAGWHRAPQRIVLLTQWGEGPHMSALALTPLALACIFLAFEKRRPWALGAASLLCAAVLSTDYYAAAALLLFSLVLLWSFWITRLDSAVFARAGAIAILTWGLTAFWLVPSLLRVTRENIRLVAQPSTNWSIWIFVAAAIAYLLITDKLARGRPERLWTAFVSGSAALLLLYVLANEYFGFRIAGDPSRLVPELELALVLVAVEVLTWLWSRPAHLARAAAVVIVLVSLAGAAPYVRRHKVFFPGNPQFDGRPESQLQEWMRAHLPNARALTAGSIRLWYNTWYDLAQLGGGSDQGIDNGRTVAAEWQVLLGDNADLSIAWLHALGVDAVIENGPQSQELYHDFQHPGKFADKLSVLFDNHAGDIIYGVPRRFPGIGRVVEAAGLRRIAEFGGAPDPDALRAYNAVVEQGPDAPVAIAWQGSDSFQAHASLAPGQLLLIQESWDPAWRAEVDGKDIPVHPDPIGFIAADAPAGEHDVRFRFSLPLENAIGRVVTGLALGALVFLAKAKGRK